MDIDAIIRVEKEAESAIREILLDLERETGRMVEWVKVDVKDDCTVTVNTVSSTATLSPSSPLR